MRECPLAVAITLLSSLFAAGNWLAQKRELPTVQIPFSFDVVGKIYSPGEYRYETKRTSMGDLHLLSSPDGHLLQILSTAQIQSEKSEPGRKLVFRRSGAHCTLTEIWNGEAGGQQILPSTQEKEAELAGGSTDVTVIAQTN
jgi:hypothetical protein